MVANLVPASGCRQGPDPVSRGNEGLMSMKLFKSHLWPGVPLALVSAVLFGASAPFAKVLLGTVDAQLLAGLMYVGAGLGLAIGHFGRAAVGLPAPEASLRKADYPWLAAVVLAGGVAGPLLLMLGLARTSASSGSLLLNLGGSPPWPSLG